MLSSTATSSRWQCSQGFQSDRSCISLAKLHMISVGALSYRWASILLWSVWQAIHSTQRTATPSSDPHRGEAIHVQCLWADIHRQVYSSASYLSKGERALPWKLHVTYFVTCYCCSKWLPSMNPTIWYGCLLGYWD